MNRLYRWGGQAVWSLLGLPAGGCDESDRVEAIWDFVGPSVVLRACVRPDDDGYAAWTIDLRR